MRLVTIAAIASLLVFGSLGGCAMEQKKVMKEASTSQPVDCRYAEGDIRILQNEKAYLVERAAEGFSAITPAGAILGVLTGTELTKVEVAIGVYDEKLDERIAQIKAECGL
jgi:hypothetical protein